MVRRKRREHRREEPSLGYLAVEFSLRWMYMVFLVTGVLFVVYPIRGILHINYEVVGNAFPYFAGFPLIVLGFVGAWRSGHAGDSERHP